MFKLDYRLKFFLVAVIMIMLVGTIGFSWLEHLSFLDSFYFTFITVATVGYGDISPHTDAGKVLAMAVIVFGVGTFLGVVASSTDLLLERRELDARRRKLNMVLGLFFGEVGTDLLARFSRHDSRIGQVASYLLVNQEWRPEDFARASREMTKYQPAVDSTRVGIEELHSFLSQKSDFFIRLFENPTLLEHEGFTELLRALLHLREELMHRGDFAGLPDSDHQHLSGDINRVHRLLILEWLDYMKYLGMSYPYLFSLALRTNPFDSNTSPVVR